VFQIENLKVQEDSLDLAKDFYDIEKARVDVGIKAPLDLAQAEASVASREEAVIVAESAVRDAEDRLKQLMDLPADSELWAYPVIPKDRPEVKETDVSLEGSIEEAMENRPEIKVAKYGIESDEIRLEYSKNQLKPELNLNASYGLAGLGGTLLERQTVGGPVINEVPGGYVDALEQVFTGDFRNWSLGVALVIPIKNRYAESQHLTRRLTLQQDKDNLKNLEAQVIQEVRRAVRKLETDIKRVRVARVARELEEKKLDAEQKKYEHGLSTSFEVLEFQTDVTRARSEEIRAITDFNRSSAALEQAQGTILDAFGIKHLND
jgi:outer membrane protein TolC